ncbi:Inhibitor of growth protein-like protein [Emericellopsis cladophorae]|uniref:Inhibitor of growth protein-like protein n=1 Tax=Emericellopsis cladophorae TaxID=2686198 RepID=A0A9P9Y6K6_9HYPO|nr:Inhibitor of growth protein-like protein [Emericellopsis cladophorae]KAI6783869.1 Inhibitor of growth protein-like protein [Emericellopsis cladophorae]
MAAQTNPGGDTLIHDAPDLDSQPQGRDEAQGDQSEDSETRADPDAHTTVTDFLDFTEYLPSDMTRSLTLIGQLDQRYIDASHEIHDLTKRWGQLPTIPVNERPSPVKLRADISEQLNQALSSRTIAHAEAVRMSEHVDRHYNKAKALLAKLQTIMDNYPAEADIPKSPVMSRSPQATRNKGAAKVPGEEGQRRKPKIPKITVPGQVLAPYDIEYDTATDGSAESSEEEDDAVVGSTRRTPAPVSRIKLVTATEKKTPKTGSRPPRATPRTVAPTSAELQAHEAALQNPPPPNAVVGSADAPWLQLTDFELAKLRKRMKKNATWTPSETMVARELSALGRGPEEYREAKRKAEEEGKPFDPTIPTPLPTQDGSTGQQLPAGAISADSLAAEEVPTSNRGMKLNEAKRLKREALAKLAAEEAEETARSMTATAQLLLGSSQDTPSNRDAGRALSKAQSQSAARPVNKRKREAEADATSEAAEGDETPSARPLVKRTKTETPVPPPQIGRLPPASVTRETTATRRHPTPASSTGGGFTETPVPIPVPLKASGSSKSARAQQSPTPSIVSTTNQTRAASAAAAAAAAAKAPGKETPVPLPRSSDRRRSAVTPAAPSREAPSRDATKRETRGEAAKRNSEREEAPAVQPVRELPSRSSARAQNASATESETTTPPPGVEPATTRRPSSRGKALSQEPQPTLAAERPRRASTAHNTPAPEAHPPSRRAKRPAPGIVSTNSSGGSAAVGRRKAAPKKKKIRTTKKKGDTAAEVEFWEEVDDEGTPIDPEEPRYCLCNRVSFGEMIQCDNDSCRYEWFHLECVGLTEEDIPKRTTKWYCPDCRKMLNIGEKGEVSARGVKR